MGAEYQETQFFGPKNDTDHARYQADLIIDAARYNYGSAGYSGTFAECCGVDVKEDLFTSWDAASEYLQNTAEKWGNAIVVRVEPPDQKGHWLMGAWCSS